MCRHRWLWAADESRGAEYVMINEINVTFVHKLNRTPGSLHLTYGATSELGSYVNSSTPIMAFTVADTK